ncbi:MAG: UDP-N-acetylmuramoyl-L-alanyl-D-glutamate--2,6-diaminopimelate ligase [Thermomicrobiales bacterium]|nr:UDP-N-acetylmuramoyl-L-alanyl-D-glutamate--2,6-diaminopimelate ligase [Thermomicrobiales bacterium]
MPSATLTELVSNHPELRLSGDLTTRVTGMQYDSRLIAPGDLFVAIPGGHFDGHAFISDAVARGAVAVMAERDAPEGLPAILAADTRQTLPPVAATFFGRPSLELGVIGITGTDGKTTTSYLVDAILRDGELETGMVGTVSVRIAGSIVDHETRQTTPESLDVQRYLRQMVDADVQWAILEATSHGLDLHRLDEVRFAIGAVTNVTHEHLEHHKTIESYRRAKGILFERLSASGGTAVVNLDDEGAREMLKYACGSNVLTYSVLDPVADIRAADIVLGVSGSRFELVTPQGSAWIDLPLVGGFNVANALCAAGVAIAAAVPLQTIADSLACASPVPGRMARIDLGQPFTVIVDYAHTPESLTKVLQLLRSLNPDGRLLAVSGSAGDRDTTKRPLQGEVSAKLADVSVFTTEDPRFEDPDIIIDEIAAGAARVGARRGYEYHCVTDRREAIRLALSLARPGDCILLAGKGHERSIIWGHEKRPWDEAGVARELLTELGFGVRG